MFKTVSILLLAFTITSCVQDKPIETDPFIENGKSLSLENRIAQLELENAMKDSLINESLSFFNEIQSNLMKIGIRKDEIRAISENNEISGDDKSWILEEIQHINYLREENANKVRRMQNQMKENGLKIKELDLMIESLIKDIQWKDEQINLLQTELHSLDQEYSALFDSYQEQAIIVDELTEEMNTVYYAYGTAKELRENGVIEKKNGFLGIGKKVELKSDLNDQYFTKINATKVNAITIQGTDMRFVTNHPHSSYLVKELENKTIIEINNPTEFWKISKYLVVTVD
ncbi:MAG TPA: hypothetical protein EYG86_07110 [Crocinitomicaceae bacterium]|nr:hypothetical protein [Crocinitomicaceae bacterium]